MVFQHPEYIRMILAAGAAIFIGYIFLFFRGSRIMMYFSGGRTRPVRDITRALALTLAFIAFAIAFWTGPQFMQVREIPKYEQAEICFAIDASRSALARDIYREGETATSRFNFAKDIVREAKMVVSPYDAPCLIFFAGSAIVAVSPRLFLVFADIAWDYVTSDLRYADEYFVEYEITQGSSFASMLPVALAAFSESRTRKILIVLSDGEPERGDDTVTVERRNEELAELNKVRKAIADFRRNRELVIEFFGIGDTARASAIPKMSTRNGASPGYLVYPSGPKKGQTVMTRPDPAFLFSAAKSLGGRYRHVKTLGEAKRELSSMLVREKKVIYLDKKEELSDGWQYFVISGLVLLFAVPFVKSP